MFSYKRLFITLAFIVFCLFLLSFIPETNRVTLSLNNRFYVLDVARTDQEQHKGLAGVSFLFPRRGVLFIFSSPNYHGIWMKNMLIPIDIIWLSRNLTVINTVSNVSPSTYPQVYYPQSPDSFVIELSSGEVDREQIKRGDSFHALSPFLLN